MPQRVQVHVEQEQEAGQAVDNELTEQRRRDEEMRTNLSAKQLSETFGPILSVMKLAGELFGETALAEPRDASQGKFFISRYYSALIVLGQWALVLIVLTSHFYEGFSSMNIFFYLLVTTIWYVQCTCSSTICLVVLPLVQNRRSRFAQFISSFVTTATELGGLRRKVLKGLTIACLASLANSIVIVLLSNYYGGVISVFKPWDGHAAIRVVEIVFGIFNSFAWILPVQFYCVICLVLERMFEMLKKKVTSSLDTAHSFSIANLRQEHLKLCKVVELADKVVSPLLFVIIALDIPLICINVYQAIKTTKAWSNETDVTFFIGYLYWSVCIWCLLAVLCMFGHRVNEKAHSFHETLQKCHVSAQDIKENSELMLFLAHVQGEPIGLSVGGLAVINKSLFLTLVGIIVSYFVVLLTLPS